MTKVKFRLELLEVFDDDENWFVKYAVMLIKSEDIYDGTVCSYKRIAILSETDNGLVITWDCGRGEGYPGCVFDATTAINNYIESL